MGLATASDRTLWRDRAMTELNLAVLHSFTAAGVTISDHHTESARFLKHLEREESQGRACPADWTWIVPPAASSATPVFHRYYQDFDQAPNFYRHPPSAPRLPCCRRRRRKRRVPIPRVMGFHGACPGTGPGAGPGAGRGSASPWQRRGRWSRSG